MTEEFMNDFCQAEMVNETNESSNPWNWKKGEILHQWTTNKSWKIVKVDEYPECGITVKEHNDE